MYPVHRKSDSDTALHSIIILLLVYCYIHCYIGHRHSKHWGRVPQREDEEITGNVGEFHGAGKVVALVDIGIKALVMYGFGFFVLGQFSENHSFGYHNNATQD